MARLWLLGITMLMALGVVLGVNLFLEGREARAAFDDFRESQVKVATAAACVLLSNLEASPSPLPWVLRDLHPLEQPGITRLFVRPPGLLWMDLDGLAMDSAPLTRAVAANGRWFPVAPADAATLGLPERNSALALSGAVDRDGRTWIVAVAGTASREPDRSLHARWRLLASFVSMGAFLFTLAFWALRFQKQEMELAREIERRELGRHKDQLLAQADRAATMLTLASGVAHEIATPLGVISGRAAQLVARTGGDERNLRLTQTIQEEVEQINRTIRRFLELARGGKPRAEEFGPRDLVAAAAAMVEHRFQKAGVELPGGRPGGPARHARRLPAAAAPPGQPPAQRLRRLPAGRPGGGARPGGRRQDGARSERPGQGHPRGPGRAGAGAVLHHQAAGPGHRPGAGDRTGDRPDAPGRHRHRAPGAPGHPDPDRTADLGR